MHNGFYTALPPFGTNTACFLTVFFCVHVFRVDVRRKQALRIEQEKEVAARKAAEAQAQVHMPTYQTLRLHPPRGLHLSRTQIRDSKGDCSLFLSSIPKFRGSAQIPRFLSPLSLALTWLAVRVCVCVFYFIRQTRRPNLPLNRRPPS